ncbi:MAG: TetR/AcrR family transcriptional regulator [Paludibacteraceae bacterium]|nr:TetR/AcrR family transcriptional regulator [Paludibacteraceae bacterium]
MSAECREKIIKGALNLFMAQGIKSVTMDKVAASLSVSKRTIYELFSDKRQLVCACLADFKMTNDQMREELRSSTSNSFSYLLEMFKYSVSMLRTLNANFFTDAEAMFPEIVEEIKLNKSAQLEHFKALIQDAQRDGHIVQSFSSDVLAEVYYGMLSSMRTSGYYDYSRTPSSEILRILCNIYFRGVATPMGLSLIHELLGEDGAGE